MKKQTEIYINNKENIISFNITSIDKYKLFDIFTNNPKITIYITEQFENNYEKIVGLITSGDFKRHICGGKALINRNFLKVNCKNTQQAYEILKNPSIWSVPIVDDNDVIVQEYCKFSDKNDTCNNVAFDDFCNTFIELLSIQKKLIKYNHIVLLYDGHTMSSQNKVLKINNSQLQLSILDKISLHWIEENEYNNKQEHSICVIIMNCNASSVIKSILEKYCIDNILWDITLNTRELNKIIFDSLSLYNNIALIAKETCYENKLSERNDIYYLDISDFLWNDKYECYEYIQNEQFKHIECVFTIISLFKKPYIIINNVLVPIISLNPNEQEAFIEEDIDIAYNIIPKLQKNNVQCIVFNNPELEVYQEKSLSIDLSNRQGKAADLFNNSIAEISNFINPKEELNTQMIEELSATRYTFILHNGMIKFSDIHGKYVNFVNGERYTCCNPIQFDNILYLYGPCVFFGSYVEDKYTIGSLLRDNISSQYYIMNCGIRAFRNINYRIRNNDYKPGDIVIIFAHNRNLYELNGIKVHSIINAYKKVNNLQDNVWDRLLHCNKIITKYIAEEIYNVLIHEKVFCKKNIKTDQAAQIGFGVKNINAEIPCELEEWLSNISNYKKQVSGKAGAIVMNCNPFTLGHRYLIEYAKNMVDVLYIFVVEENKSFFDFNDRMNMVKIGVSDMENIIVVPSGKYIISSQTLPGYFTKEDNPDIEFDASTDLQFFGKVIAKKFDISIRFAGEEPTDSFTQKYNEYMRNILPNFGVEFCEIPRKKANNGKVISATFIRKCMKEHNYEKIKDYVMPEIYDYLKEYYFE